MTDYSLKEEEEVAHKRSILSYNKRPLHFYRALIGTFLYIVVFVGFIPYLLIEYRQYEILMAYFSNVDMIATSLGYNGGPNIFTENDNYWLYLYNPSNFTLFGFFSTTIINYFALLGFAGTITYISATKKSWIQGWSMAFFMIMITYLLPGNIIVMFQEYLEYKLNYDMIPESCYEYILIAGSGIILSILIIIFESIVLKHLHKPMVQLIEYVVKKLKI